MGVAKEPAQCLLVRLFQKRGILVDVGNREAKTEAARFDGVASCEGRERPEALFLAPEDFDEGKLSTDQQVCLHAGAGTILPGFLAAIARFGVGREDFCHQRGMADDFSRSSSAWIATHGDIGADPGVFRQVQRDS